MRGCLLTVLVGVALVAFIAKPVTATTVDRNGTEVSGRCGPLWSMLAGGQPTYDDVAATDNTDIGVREDSEAVGRACRKNAYRRVGIGAGALVVGAVFARLRSGRRAKSSPPQPPAGVSADT